MSNANQLFRKSKIVLAVLATTAALGACGGGASSGDGGVRATEEQGIPTSDLQLRVQLPQRMMNLGIPLDVVVTVAGDARSMSETDDVYFLDIPLPKNREYAIFIAVRRQADKLILGSAQMPVTTDSDTIALAVPEQLFSTEFDSDSDGFTNIAEIERGSAPNSVSEDFDGDGIANDNDTDDDNDGIIDAYDAFPLDATENTDTDGDGIGDNRDRDDDNDSILDVDDKFPLDASESLDLDLDGLGNSVDLDDDGDGTIDLEDPQPSNPNITGNEDSDGDGVRDLLDAFPYNAAEQSDNDGDGIGDIADNDDDNNGIPDDQENSIVAIPYSTNVPTIDGAYGWSEWRSANYTDNKGNYLVLDHLMIDNDGTHSDGSTNQYRGYWNNNYWRAVHDGTHLYVLLIVRNEPFYERFNDSADMWQDDTAELYFDVGNEKSSAYDGNDYQRLFRYNHDAVDDTLVGYNSATGLSVTYRSSRAMEMANQTRSVYEFKIHLASIGLETEKRFGFDIQVNDDDNGGERDAKWGWFAPSFTDESWNDPSQFGTAILAPVIAPTNRD